MIIVPILTTSLIHFSLKGWENVLFELGSERVNQSFLVSSNRFPADETLETVLSFVFITL